MAVVICYAIYALAQDKGVPFGGTQRWEYKLATLERDGNGSFDALGKEGWELVAVTPAVYTPNQPPRLYSDSHAYFKRPARILLNGPPDAH
jgi:hypothetical protein